ncbi:hypothetical protein P171DRAFT_481745 [Karstenula rhodostoma CBS 690.94]|uniref:Myb-like domain-containing protein n=1 Tax=Karstenula rhodostoma CBS 690.94 TaxID=1392251 RepID=A0A9P4PR33_9PLEO|nr:hypothetical protein P171DRAFT_481745 [Karstenula rhodostoma CBS 690.94]
MKTNLKAARGGAPWLAEDNAQIEDAVRNDLDLKQICALFPSRSADAVRHRVIRARRTINAANVQANPQPAKTVDTKTPDQYAKSGQVWTAEETEILNNAIQNRSDFAHIRTLFPERSADAVRRRYNRNLQKANLKSRSKTASKNKNSPWTAEDDQKVQDAVRANIGRDAIHAMFPTRSVDAVRIRVRRTKALQDENQESAPLRVARGDGVQADQPQFKLSQVQSSRSSSPAKIDHDYVIGPVPDNGEFMMSGALPIPESAAFADEPQIRETSRSSESPHRVNTWNVQAFEDLPRSSTPEKPVVEPLTPPFRAQELPAIEDREYASDYFSYEPNVGNNNMSDSLGWFHRNGNGRDLGSDMFSPTARAFLHAETWSAQNDFLEDHPAGNPTQEQLHHSVLPQGSLAINEFPPPIVPYAYHPESSDNGYGKYLLSMDDHPDLRNGFHFTPTPHDPVAPSNFVTPEQLFADPSVAPSVFMGNMAPIADDRLFDMSMNFLPDAGNDMVTDEDVVADDDMMEE